MLMETRIYLTAVLSINELLVTHIITCFIYCRFFFLQSPLTQLVSSSVDGVPFLMRDHTLRRTTDVGQIFPDRQFSEASFFNWTEIRSLNAGQWFLKVPNT